MLHDMDAGQALLRHIIQPFWFFSLLGTVFPDDFTQSQTSSSSTRTPPQSLGCRKMTGFPWAPVLGFSERVRTFLPLRSSTAAWMLSTSRQMWCMPPLLFLSRKPWTGLFSPKGNSNSNLVFPASTNTVVTPWLCRGFGSLTFKPKVFL
uniref:Putative secreted protein n=1 Tax=Ixodes ricinus TaxID=34613 RepID=A0A6B0UV50_IXORI